MLLPYWPPACSSGSILVTSRNHNLQFGPADKGIEVTHYDPDSGSKLLLHLLRMNIVGDISINEAQSALELSQQLDGHALAISFMTGLIQKRSWSIQEFLSIYERNKRDLHGQRGPNALSTIWHLSFKSLGPESAALLGILAYINPDSVAQELFTKAEKDSLPALLRESANELDFYDVVEPLLTLALVNRDKTTKAFSTHQLVKTQYRYQLTQSERQDSFDQAVKLIAEGFSRVHSQLYDR